MRLIGLPKSPHSARSVTERSYRIVIADLPDAEDRRDLLELVLAAASLDLRVQLLLLGRAHELLTSADDSAWRQLLDHGLAEVLICRSRGCIGTVADGARLLTSESLAEWPAADVVIRT